jgi:hypothetical protein
MMNFPEGQLMDMILVPILFWAQKVEAPPMLPRENWLKAYLLWCLRPWMLLFEYPWKMGMQNKVMQMNINERVIMI